MTWTVELAIFAAGLLFLLLMGQWIAFALGTAGLLSLYLHGGLRDLASLANIGWNSVNDFVLTAVPLFVFMGEVILRSGLSQRFYRGVAAWLGGMPGGLLHSNVVACAIFAAIRGSSVATAASIGTVAIPELTERRYDRPMIFGSLAAGGTLGILIPPSIVAILYAVQVQQSVAHLFMAGVIPGILLTLLFMAYIAIRVKLNPSLVPEESHRADWGDRIRGLGAMSPIVGLMILILGGIYFGIMTPTEAAAVGVSLALVFSVIFGRLNLPSLMDALRNTVSTTCMVVFIIVGAQIMSFALVKAGINRAITEWVAGLGVSSMVLFVIIGIIYIILGFFIDGISMMLLTLPVLFPIIQAQGFDPIWFGIALVVFIELGQITPPMGLNLFVIHGISGGRPFGEVVRGAIPYCGIMLLVVVLLTIFPELALWLPKQMTIR